MVVVQSPVTPVQFPEVRQTVPVSSGKVQVLFDPVRSDEVIVPVKVLVAVVVWGLMAMMSVFAVVEPKVAELVVVSVEEKAPDAWVNPVRPDIAPAELTSQLVVSTARVPLPPPIETRPVEVPVAIFTGWFMLAFIFTPPDPDWILVVEVVLVEPRFTVWAAAPVPRLTVLAWLVVPRSMFPVPEFSVREEVEAVEPSVTVFAPVPPVARSIV